MMAEREDLGDLKLYRIPIPVTVASNSQKQVALLEQPTVIAVLTNQETGDSKSAILEGTFASLPCTLCESTI